jgi:hypothetical protein
MFYANSQYIGDDTTPPTYERLWTNIGSGTYQITAVAYDKAGGATTSSAVTVVANDTPLVNVTKPVNGSVAAAPRKIDLAASASDSDGLEKVEFYIGTNKVGQVSSAPYVMQTATVYPSGTYTVTAKVSDKRGKSATSAPVTITLE